MFDMIEIKAKSLVPNWKGASFGDEIGIWFHALVDLDIAYTGGEISKFRPGVSSVYDKKSLDIVVLDDDDNNAKAVPEPATAAARVYLPLLPPSLSAVSYLLSFLRSQHTQLPGISAVCQFI